MAYASSPSLAAKLPCLVLLGLSGLGHCLGEGRTSLEPLETPGRHLQQVSHPYDFLIPYHGWFMTTAFAIILPAGIMMPLLFKKTKYWSMLFWVHVLIQITGVLFISAGVGMGAKLFRNSDSQAIHRAIGIAVITLVWLQVFVALGTRPLLSNKTRSRGLYYIFHRWGGATALIVGIGNAYYGMMISGPATRYFAGYSVALGGWILIAMFGQAAVYTKRPPTEIVDFKERPTTTVV